MFFFILSNVSKNHVLELLYEKYRYLMYHVAYDILKDDSLAEDIVHNVFLKLTRTAFKIDDISSTKTRAFMIIVTRNIAIDIYNKRKNENILYLDDDLFEVPTEDNIPLDMAINHISIHEIQRTLGIMDIKYADVIMLKYFYDYLDLEISSLLGISEQLVRVRLHRAKKILINIMVERDDAS